MVLKNIIDLCCLGSVIDFLYKKMYHIPIEKDCDYSIRQDREVIFMVFFCLL